MPTISKEDYLKAIYRIADENEKESTVTTSEVAEMLDVSKAATSEMVQRLSELGYLNHERYKGVKLTDEGMRTALNIIRRHRIWELFLTDVLGLSWNEVHAEAELLEHSTSDFLIEKLDEFLGHPRFNPHGEPIPDRNGNLPEQPALLPLSCCETGKEYRLAKVLDDSLELMNYFTGIGLALNVKVLVKSRLDYDNSTVLCINGTNHNLSEKAGNNLFFLPENDEGYFYHSRVHQGARKKAEVKNSKKSPGRTGA
ncbi:MAG: metal-dependent transcriptional regulator [Ignavibacteriales bacterium]|jgi:Mn-dependent transcriptional regulator|nr:MAG: metal-dependent transcriptional regulator [Ignavibacteriaceae bacterium]MBW7873206.1 metal-dependent transcriptional regulator [Ignavibacteria bacterium]MCZ2142848.1 metal-dependent transcriptional regulator [Ignavibacteriales bacterium]OQY70365.1 MAG: hypothetical protein B6D45_11290 [Ignavibacteriales bacterium UTCHB3]MBV6443942.1 Transcriptional regulator MntR [Ignavibacteriaceae bacterium]